MRIAIVYNDNDIYVEFSPEKFKLLLKEVMKETDGDIDKSFEQIIGLLKKETIKS